MLLLVFHLLKIEIFKNFISVTILSLFQILPPCWQVWEVFFFKVLFVLHKLVGCLFNIYCLFVLETGSYTKGTLFTSTIFADSNCLQSKWLIGLILLDFGKHIKSLYDIFSKHILCCNLRNPHPLRKITYLGHELFRMRWYQELQPPHFAGKATQQKTKLVLLASNRASATELYHLSKIIVINFQKLGNCIPFPPSKTVF